MKFMVMLAALLAVGFAATTVYEEGSPSGALLYSGNTESQSTWEGSWQSKKVRYPTKNGEYSTIIGFLKIVNNIDSSYSSATIKEGGVGSNYVEIEYYAPAFHGYDYNVEIRSAEA